MKGPWRLKQSGIDPRSTEEAPLDLANKRIAVIGTGSTGVQIIQEMAKIAGHLYVFQRSPTWCTPLGNSPLSDEEIEAIRNNYDEIDRICDSNPASALTSFMDQSIFDVSEKEREETLETLYKGPGFKLWAGAYRDMLTDPKANAIVTEFVSRKIRERVKDPKIAERLIPKDHGFGIRRVPLETRYYEVYNQDNVTLVDVNENPIERISPDGIQTADGLVELDVIIYAAGFDPVRGAVMRVDVRGRDGITFGEAWRDGTKTFLGIQTAGFPNFFTLVGAQNATGFGNVPRNSCRAIDWLAGLFEHMRSNNLRSVEATEDAQREYTDLIMEYGKGVLFSSADSWFTGVNKNISGRNRREIMFWVAGMQAYLQLCNEVSENGWRGFRFG